ncbi:FUSC family protein [Bradyrhizobium sp. STM 3562]|uniref:FUSC family protein n=1 Tax=Bradyrhizobium sp. STM 3562 TaxID=578924 RepID=UPI0038901E98
MTQDRPFLVRHADLIFALKTFAAAMLALVIALWLNLPRPYWAMASVYITSQPLAGATSSKAVYRLIGTLVGAATSVLMVPNLVNAPELLCLAVAAWVSLCLYFSLMDGTPRSYAFMLSGYTVAIIGFPAVSDPGNIFDAAVARVQEISLGIICASLISSTFFPRGIGAAAFERLGYWLATARELSREALAGGGTRREQRLQQLLREAVELETLQVHLAYDRLSDVGTAQALRMLRPHMLLLPAILASINDRITALGPRLRTDHPGLARLFDDISAWIVDDSDAPQAARELQDRIEAQRPRLGTGSDWDQILITSLLIRLQELIDLLQDCRAVGPALAQGTNPSRVSLRFKPESGVAQTRYRDRTLAMWSAGGAAASVLLCCAFWIGTGWPDGASAPMMAAVGSSIFASQDDPTIGIRRFGVWAAVAIMIVAVYLFALLPPISTLEALIVLLAPAFILFGYLMARPATTSIGTALGVNAATLMALQSAYAADFVAFANSSIAFIIGIVAAIVVTRTARSVGAEWIAHRVLRAGWVSLAVAAEHRGRRDRASFLGAMLGRLDQLVQRLAAIPEIARRDVDNLSQLRVGLNIIDLRRARHHLSPTSLHAIDRMLDRLATAFRSHSEGPMPRSLLSDIDAALAATVDDPGAAAKEDALLGLVGIRRGLFPDSPAYGAHSSLSGQRVA